MLKVTKVDAIPNKTSHAGDSLSDEIENTIIDLAPGDTITVSILDDGLIISRVISRFYNAACRLNVKIKIHRPATGDCFFVKRLPEKREMRDDQDY